MLNNTRVCKTLGRCTKGNSAQVRHNQEFPTHKKTKSVCVSRIWKVKWGEASK